MWITRALRLQPRGRVVIPPSPPTAEAAGRGEYAAHQHLHPHLDTFLDPAAAAEMRRHRQLEHFQKATSDAVEGVWRDSRSHLRKQRELVESLGVEGAIRETLTPSRTSFREDLRQRPLDRAILEEIYTGLHGRRVERRLKRGVTWEHWITKGDGTAPVYTASQQAQRTFAFGGHIRLVGTAAHPKQFPLLSVGGETGGTRRRPSSQTKATTKKDAAASTAKAARCGPDAYLPEVAFVGRTSSGKSSLVNALVNAMVSPYGHLQGTTSSLRFYSIAHRILFVDCPGYGYYNPMATPPLDAECAVKAMRAYLKSGARRRTLPTRSASRDPPEGPTGTREARGTAMGMEVEEEWDDTARAHHHHLLQPQRNLKRVFVCVSARGLQHTDLEYCDWLNRMGIPFSVVLTKTDAAPIRFLARLTDYTRCQLVHYAHCRELMLTSALRLAGIDKMQNLISSMAMQDDPLQGATMNFDAIV